MNHTNIPIKRAVKVRLTHLLSTLDSRDYPYERTGKPIPKVASLAKYLPSVYDQESVGSCTMNSYAGVTKVDHSILQLGKFNPSRMFGYHAGLKRMGDVSKDTGLDYRTMLAVALKDGLCEEDLWNYSHSFSEEPPPVCWTQAKDHLITQYRRLGNSPEDLYDCIANAEGTGRPVLLAIPIHKSFMTSKVAKTGKVPMPNQSWFTRWMDPLEGYHEVFAFGYDLDKDHIICRNSWGVAWGDQGNFYLPLDYPHEERWMVIR